MHICKVDVKPLDSNPASTCSRSRTLTTRTMSGCKSLFQDGGANGELLSPWQHVSPESLSPSFEVVGSDSSHNKTPESKSTPEAPLPHPTTSVTPSSQNQVGGASSFRHGGGSSASGEGVNVGSRGEGQGVWSRQGEGGVGREVRMVRARLEEALQQIQTLSQYNQRLLQQQVCFRPWCNRVEPLSKDTPEMRTPL